MEQRYRLSFWLSLLSVALVFWLMIQNAALILEIAGILFGALLLSLAMAPLVERLARYRIPASFTVLLFYVLVGLLLAMLAGLLRPVIHSEMLLLRQRWPSLLHDASTWLANIPGLGSVTAGIGQDSATSLKQQVETMLSSLFHTLVGVGGLALDGMIVLVLAFFFTTEPRLTGRLLQTWVPAPRRAHFQTVLAHLRLSLTRWIWAQGLIALYFALVYSLGLSVLHIPFALTIGIVGGLLEIVPYLGGALALLLAAISALSISPVMLLWVMVFHIIVVELESHVLAPALYGKVIGVHPALMLIALLIGAKLGGVLGVFFAVPSTVVLLTLVQELRGLYAGSVPTQL